MRAHHLVLAAAAVALAVAPNGARVAAEEAPAPEYDLVDLGAVEAEAINDAGVLLLNTGASGPLPRCTVATIDAEGDLVPTPVPGLAGGNGSVTGRALSSGGAVVGISHAGEYSDEMAPEEPFFRAFRWSGGASVDLGADTLGEPLPDPPDFASEAFAVNDAGVVAGQTRLSPNAVDYRAVVWRTGVAPPVVLSADRSCATVVDPDGRVIGWRRIGVQQRLAMWTGAGEFDVDVPGSFFATPHDVNASGQLVGARLVTVAPNPPYDHAFLLQLDGTSVVSNVDLGVLPTGRDSRATAIDEEGVVVGWSSVETSPGLYAYRAVRWKDGAIVDLNALVNPDSPGIPRDAQDAPLPWRLTHAVDVNARGHVLCRGTVGAPGSETPRSFLLRARPKGLVAEPGTVAFGDVPVGDTAERTLVVTNGTSQALQVRLSRPAKPFAIVGATKFPLAPGESRSVQVRAAPKDDADVAAQVTVSSDRGSPVTASLAARGVPPVRVTPATVDFGKVWGKGVEEVTLTNRSSRRVRAALSGLKPPFALLGAKTVVLGPEEARTVEVEFKPARAPEAAGTLVVKPDVAKTVPATADVRGTGATTLLVGKVVGEVLHRKGAGDDFQPLAEGAELEGDEEVTTGVESTVVLMTPNGGTIELRELTQIRAQTVLAADLADVKIQLKVGEVKARITPKKSLESNFDVATPVATAGVRGTVFETVYDEATQTTTVRVTEGKVLVTPQNAALRKVLVPAGRQVRVTPTSVSPLERL